MDGLLINSEPYWVKSEKQVFETAGVHLTDELCYQTFGMRIQEVVPYWHRKFPWDEKAMPFDKLAGEIVENVCSLIEKNGSAFDGVEYILGFFNSKEIPMALASSSPMKIIDTVMDKLKISKEFKVIYSAENEEYGKPHPAVYITTAKKLGVQPVDCLAFEDSFNGIISAKAALMKTIAVPDLYNFYNPRFDIADVKLRKLKDFTEEEFKKINIL